MVKLSDVEQLLAQQHLDDAAPNAPERVPSNYVPLQTFALDKSRQYQQQFADLYFLRLTKIRPAVEAAARAAWEDTVIGGEEVRQAERVLDVRQGALCWATGTIYVDMALKPNILDDVSKDRWISAPSSVERYYAGDDSDAIMLEDDSGRVRLVGESLKAFVLVTGCIVAVLGTENKNGEFEVLDLKFPGLAPQPERWALNNAATNRNGKSSKNRSSRAKDEDVEMTDGSQPVPRGGKMAIVSGLEFSGTGDEHSMALDLLLEYLLGEALDASAQQEVSHISRLVIAGNSIAAERKDDGAGDGKRGHKKYGYNASSYNALPSQLLDEFLSELLPSMPVTLLPGALDPANASYPQQPIHAAMFPRSRAYAPVPLAGPQKQQQPPAWLDTVTNPWEGEVDGWRVLGTGGQNLDDILKYVDSNDRLAMMEAMCRWRCSAPTAPDTLWAYPFQEDEPFVVKECPHLYFVGCQPEFGTRVIEGDDGQLVRLIAVPSFSSTGEIVLVDSETLDVSKVKIIARA